MTDGVPTPLLPEPGPVALPRELRTKILGTILVAGIGLGASIMSCVGQSFALRQARAQEAIARQLDLLRTELQSTCLGSNRHLVEAGR